MDQQYLIRTIAEKFDPGDILPHLVELIRGGEIGPPLCELLGKLSEHDVALAAINAQLSVKLTDGMAEFYKRQREEYQNVMKISKLFGFKSWEKIAVESSMMAWKDTDLFISRINQIKEITTEMVGGMRKDLMNTYVKQIDHLLNMRTNED